MRRALAGFNDATVQLLHSDTLKWEPVPNRVVTGGHT